MILGDFLSLFYWILFSYEQNWLKENLKKVCFNPYSTGFYSFIKTEYWRRWRWYAVSILILLDSILLWKYSYTDNSIIFVSILILLDSILLSVWTNSGGSSSTKFQSLFYWILFFYPFYIEDSLFLTLIEFFWESNSIKINRYVTRFLLFFHLFP